MIYFIIWYIIGLVSSIYWYTKSKDLMVSDVIGIIIVSLLGPIFTILAYFEDIDIPSIVIFKKRNKP